MSTLTTPPASTLLERLFAEAEATEIATDQGTVTFTQEDRTGVMTSKDDYRLLYAKMKNMHLAVSRETATLLYMLARATRARAIVEYGTSFGLSTIHLAAALKDNGGGRVIGTEFVSSKVERARANIAAAGLAEFVEIREGDALETLAHNLPETIDLVLLDGAKPLYTQVLSLLEPHLRTGALIVADNADHCPDYLARVRTPGGGYLCTPIAGDVELSMRVDASAAT